jgi:very-short-patch-repair endonuclease
MKKTIAMLIDRKKMGRGFSGKTICLICGTDIKICESKIKSGMGKYCSKKCYGIAKTGVSRPDIGKKISNTKIKNSKRITKECEVCSNKIVLTPCWADKRRTCSRGCAGELNSRRLKEMWKNPPDDMIEKMREAMTKRRKSGRINKETKPEKIFREELERRKTIFEPQFGFGGVMIADFFIPRLQAFVFVDGSYWHGLPSSIAKDWQQVQYIRTKGMKAYRFSDKEIYDDVGKCVDIVFKDAEQPFSMADLIDKLIILGVKTQVAEGDKLKQVLKDYRRMDKIVISGLEFYKYTNADIILDIIKELSICNIKIFMLVEKVQKNEHTKEEAKKIQDLNSYRAELCNAINAEFKEVSEIIKI